MNFFRKLQSLKSLDTTGFFETGHENSWPGFAFFYIFSSFKFGKIHTVNSFWKKPNLQIKGSGQMKKSEIRFTVPTEIKNQLRINALQRIRR